MRTRSRSPANPQHRPPNTRPFLLCRLPSVFCRLTHSVQLILHPRFSNSSTTFSDSAVSCFLAGGP